MSIVKAHIACSIDEGCGSSDAMTVYEDGLHCFGACGKSYTFKDGEHATDYLNGEQPRQRRTMNPLQQHTSYLLPIPDRKISKETAKFYNVSMKLDEAKKITHHIYPYYNKEGEKVFNKVRQVAGKKFFAEGDNTEALMFGQTLFTPSTNISVTITEGELDALAAYQMQGSRFPVVSVRSSTEAVKNCQNPDTYRWLMGFKNIIVCFDSDEPGQKAAKAVAQLFPSGKVKLFRHASGLKDASDYLAADKQAQFQDNWFNATEYRPEGFVATSSMKGRLKDFKYEMGAPYPFKSWNDKLYGIRTGEMIMLPARPGSGKTTIMRQMMVGLHAHDPDIRVGGIFLEETDVRTSFGLMSIPMRKQMHIPTTEWTEEEFEDAWDSIMEDGRITLYTDHNGGITLQELEYAVRYYAKGLGAKYVFLDHIGRVSASGKAALRETIDAVSKSMSAMAKELDIAIIVAMHVNRDGEMFGSDAPLQDADVVIELQKYTDELTDMRTTPVEIKKNRLYGLEGTRAPLIMDGDTGILIESEDSEVMGLLEGD